MPHRGTTGFVQGTVASVNGVRSDPVGIIALLALREAHHAPQERLFRPEGRTWSADPRGTKFVKRAAAPARRVRNV